MKDCPKGEYYCFADKKCKPIPKGHHVMPNGDLMKDGEHKKINENKSGDSSLRDWFTKSRSSDGTPGWVQLGGKYAGKPCAKQPGQTTKPKCGSSKMKRDLSADEEERAFRRKNRQDPNPDRKGKAKNVATEEMNLDEKCWQGYTQKGMKRKGNKVVPNCVPVGEEKEKDHEYSMARSEIKTLKNAAKRLEKKMGKKGEGNLEAWVQSKITKAADYIDTAADYVTNEEKEELRYCPKCKKAEKRSDCAFGTSYWDKNAQVITVEAAGEKDSCYKKVKSRYSVWPSAYASGALVKCRKVGAANWGNKTKKEEFSDWRSEISEAGDWWHPDPKKDAQISGPGNKMRSREDRGQSTSAQTKPDYSKRLKPGESYMDFAKRKARGESVEYELDEAIRIPAKTGNIVLVTLTWRGKYYGIKMFFPQIKKPSRKEVQDQINKVYPGAKVQTYYVSDVKPGEQFLQTEGAAWTRAAGKNKEGGLNEKGRKSYERENPGSDLKAPSKKVGNPRRASFCSRMSGMKAKLTSKKTANDPDSRINKSLRAWNC